MRVVVGADPCKTKLQYTPVAKIKNILLIPSAHLLYSRPLTLSRRRRPRLLRKSVNSPLEKAGENPCFCPRTHHIHARLALSAGVQTMRARICSAFSCDMFARVVCLRLRRAAKLPTCVLSFVALTRHAWLARLTRARGGSFLRGGGINQCTQCVGWRRRDREEDF